MRDSALDLQKFVFQSNEKAYKESLEQLWKEDPNYKVVLEALEPAALGAFSHTFPTIHVPKEHEYLQRFLDKIPLTEQLDFLRRYIEYLVWSPKYILSESNITVSEQHLYHNLEESFFDSAEDRKVLRALFYITKIADKNLDEARKILLKIGCVDVSQSIGHYFSCTESVLNLVQNKHSSKARNHLFTATLFLMQSSPIKLNEPKTPAMEIQDILSSLICKSGFVEYHYMIVANGLIKKRKFLGEESFLNGFATLEALLPGMREGRFRRRTERMKLFNSSEISVTALKDAIWMGDSTRALTILFSYLDEYGVTDELKQGILHSYTLIDDHPHDPHYVTVPVSIFELLGELKLDEVKLAVAHTVEFASSRIKRSGLMTKR
jgi:hypothetical protein